jgi:hypothetical protein
MKLALLIIFVFFCIPTCQLGHVGSEREICFNSIDDDGDNLTDCHDSECQGELACETKKNHYIDVYYFRDEYDDKYDVIAYSNSHRKEDLICTKQEICDNYIDDDCDNLTDCQDSECRRHLNCTTGGGCGDAKNYCEKGFCLEECPCLEGQGDCDHDYECAFGLVCVDWIGAAYGCDLDDGFRSICVPPEVTGGGCKGDILCYENFCHEDCPCLFGQGHCDSDLECAPGLVCGSPNGETFGCGSHQDPPSRHCIYPEGGS